MLVRLVLSSPIKICWQPESRDQAWELCTLFDINFEPRDMTRDDLQQGFLKLVKTLYSDKETRDRRSQFRKRLRTSSNFRKPLKVARMGIRPGLSVAA